MSMKRPVHPRIVRLDVNGDVQVDFLAKRYHVRLLLADYNFWTIHADDLETWLEDNLQGRYTHAGMGLYLENEEDYILFKLAWGGA